ncbi:MAG TPA: Bax inhibitor-1/YccA family protein [Chloroflexota bacterium]|nr:Bax inhibitor-1/YccA family protein [Chloroflexota bacterium]
MAFAEATAGALSPAAEARRNSLISRVYAWMTAGLAVTGATAAFTATTPALLNLVYGNALVLILLLVAQVALVIAISAAINRLTAATATALFLLYAALNGVTLASVLLTYTGASIALTFFITAGTFAAMSLYGSITKRDLTAVGNLAFMVLIGIILGSLVNLFLRNELIYWLLTYAGVAVFVGLIAYDTQKIKRILSQGLEGEAAGRAVILGALALYLDFVNLFLNLLRIFGRRR